MEIINNANIDNAIVNKIVSNANWALYHAAYGGDFDHDWYSEWAGGLGLFVSVIFSDGNGDYGMSLDALPYMGNKSARDDEVSYIVIKDNIDDELI